MFLFSVDLTNVAPRLLECNMKKTINVTPELLECNMRKNHKGDNRVTRVYYEKRPRM